MARLVMLDAGPLGLACRNVGIPIADQCRTWIAGLMASGVEVLIPEIADYEVRRELLRLGNPGPLRRLDALRGALGFRPITSAAMLQAADLWAQLRRAGRPTAGPYDLDADAILAGQALAAALPGDALTLATTNVRHLNRFPGIDAREWDTIP
jgi:predicted nucleic acid-binding protein